MAAAAWLMCCMLGACTHQALQLHFPLLQLLPQLLDLLLLPKRHRLRSVKRGGGGAGESGVLMAGNQAAVTATAAAARHPMVDRLLPARPPCAWRAAGDRHSPAPAPAPRPPAPPRPAGQAGGRGLGANSASPPASPAATRPTQPHLPVVPPPPPPHPPARRAVFPAPAPACHTRAPTWQSKSCCRCRCSSSSGRISSCSSPRPAPSSLCRLCRQRVREGGQTSRQSKLLSRV